MPGDLISRDEAVKLLELIRHDFENEQLVMRAAVAGECIRKLQEMEPVTLTEQKTAEARVITRLEPFLGSDRIGRDVDRCGECQERVEKRNRYCPSCGRRLIRREARHGAGGNTV